MSTFSQALDCITANNLDGLRLALMNVDANSNEGELLWAAANLGRTAIVRHLIGVTDPQFFEGALVAAVAMKRNECIGLLLQHVEHSPDSALWIACEQADVDLVYEILPHCSVYENICVLKFAVLTRDQELFDRVVSESNLDEWKHHINGSKEEQKFLRTNFKAMHENYTLRAHIGPVSSSVKRKM